MKRFATPLSALFAVILALSSWAAQAGQPYDAKAFAEAQAAGKSILVDVHAPWCPTCVQQKPIIEGLEKAHPALMVFNVDFDTAKDALRQFRVQYQSTLIVFKGKAEVGRSTGDTDPQAIGALVARAL
ncbi:thioredoxin family protein [Magnetospirillum sp. SS-4]|uniref:thioredoxin family protein n=1 Tax=Magnetospirillum sp. SS-4 TaxID=2681465 RepID=UPI0013860A43|nr:thioredoxin family protein [Magnetospirillum sp. SS-4]CAA7620148.1 Thioredoxin domain protein [Magnetospirillum sp. SS-4]